MNVIDSVRYRSAVVLAVLVLASLAPAQRFRFTHQMFPPDVVATRDIALADLDGDGDLDVFQANSDIPPYGQNRLYLNDGTGYFTAATAPTLPPGTHDTDAVALGDVDGDGDLDAFIGNGARTPGEQNLLYLNDGAGGFLDVTATTVPPHQQPTTDIALGDVDADGDLDAYIGNTISTLFSPQAGQNRLYLNDSLGAFVDVTATHLPLINDFTTTVAMGDLDADGDLDVFVGNSVFPGTQDRLYLNNGMGLFLDQTSTNLPPLLDMTTCAALGDVDADGDLDLFVGNTGNPSGGQNRLYLNDGAATLTDATSTHLPPLADHTESIVLGDVDGDGDLDAFVGNHGLVAAEQNRLYLNSGGGIFTDTTSTALSPYPAFTAAASLGDVDGDGDLDAVTADRRQDRLHMNDGSGVFTDVTTASLPGPIEQTMALGLGDLDGDGDLDVYLGNDNLVVGGAQDRLCLNNGTGLFVDVTSTHVPSLVTTTGALALGDVDGDGDLDVFLGSRGNQPPFGQNRLYLNDGVGVLTDATATNLPTWIITTNAVAMGDVDEDGDLDVFLGNVGQNQLYRNDGSGLFTNAVAALPNVYDVTLSVGLADVNGDRDLDALVGNDTGYSHRLYLNSGEGMFLDATGTHLPLSSFWGSVEAVAFGDVDGDGDVDAFLGTSYQSPGIQDRLLLNGGMGVFIDGTFNLPALIDQTFGVALGDADEDGDLDAFLGTFPARLYQNNGMGVFTDVTLTALTGLIDGGMAVAFGDADGDGDLDVVTGNLSQDRIHVNVRRQLAWRGVPRVGKPATLEIDGPPWGAWFLGFSTGTVSIPTPPLGTLRIDPANMAFVFASLLDGDGKASMTFPVPANSLLVGESIYWQAVVASPAMLTNLEVTTITNL